jgi:hypothetical protein
MFNFKVVNFDDSGTLKNVAMDFTYNEQYRLALFEDGRLDAFISGISSRTAKLRKAGCDDLVNDFNRLTSRDLSAELTKAIKKRNNANTNPSVPRVDIQHSVDFLTRQIGAFITNNKDLSSGELRELVTDTFKSEWQELHENEGSPHQYTLNKFDKFLTLIGVSFVAKTSSTTPAQKPSADKDDDSEGSSPLKWLVGGGVVLAALFGVWTFFSQIGKSTKPIESPTEVGGANISKQEVKRLIDLLDELQITMESEKGKLGDLKLIRHAGLSSAFLQYCETLQRIFVSGSVDHKTFTRVTPHIAFFIKYQSESYVIFEMVSNKYEVGSLEYKEDIEASGGYLLAVHLNVLIAEAVIATNPRDRSGLVETILFVTMRKLNKLESILRNLEPSEQVDLITKRLEILRERTERLAASYRKTKR